MAARSTTTDSRRFVFRAPDKSPEPYYIPINRSGSNVSKSSTLLPAHARPHIIRSADMITPRTEVETPARRIVVIRNTKHHPVDQGHVDLGDFGKPNAIDTPPVISDGHKSVFLIRRPIAPPELTKSIESNQPVEELSPTTSLEHIRTPSPLQRIVPSPEQPRSPSPIHSPPIRPKSSKQPISSARTEYSQRRAPYLRRPKSKPRTPSPVPVSTVRRSPSPSNRPRSKPVKHHSPTLLPPKQEEPKETGVKRGFFSFFSKKNTNEQINAPPPVIIETDQHTIQNRPISRGKSAQRKKSASSSAKSTKSVVFVNPDDQSIAVIENSNVKGESLRPIVKRPKSFKKTRFQDEVGDESTETLVKTYRRQRCLNCLSRHMCLIIIICFFIVLIGLAGIAVGTYFLATDSSNNLIPKIVGIAVGGVLVIAALCFFYILLACIGSRDGYFTYNDDGPHIGGRAFALIPPSHPNARLYIPRDYMKMVENSYPPPPPPSASTSNLVYNHPQLMQPVTTAPYTPHQQTIHKSNISTNNYETKPNKNNITIEMPERLLTGRDVSPRSRERSLTKVVKNIGHVVEDAKKRYNDVPTKVIVKVDENAKSNV